MFRVSTVSSDMLLFYRKTLSLETILKNGIGHNNPFLFAPSPPVPPFRPVDPFDLQIAQIITSKSCLSLEKLPPEEGIVAQDKSAEELDTERKGEEGREWKEFNE